MAPEVAGSNPVIHPKIKNVGARIDNLLGVRLPTDTDENIVATIIEVQQATLTPLAAIYGPDSWHHEALNNATARGNKYAGHPSIGLRAAVWPALQGTLRSVKAPYATAQGYLKFRNDALHADWSKIDKAVVSSCIAFVQELILKHFS